MSNIVALVAVFFLSGAMGSITYRASGSLMLGGIISMLVGMSVGLVVR